MSDTATSNQAPGITPAFLILPAELEGADTQTLVDRYAHLSEIKLAGETRVGRHPSGRNNPDQTEQDPAVREVFDAGLKAIVREMAAVMHELNSCPDGMDALLS